MVIATPTIKVSATRTLGRTVPVYKLQNQGQRNWQVWADRSTDQFRIGNNNRVSTNFAITSTGNVGIGTTDTYNNLVVKGTGDATNTDVSPTEFTSTIQTDSTFLNLGSVSNRPAIQASGGGTAYKLLLNPFQGSVGIGTNDPRGQLTVRGNGTNYDATLQLEAELGGISKPAKIRMVGTSTLGSTSQISEIISYQPTGGGGSDAALGINSGRMEMMNRIE